MADNGAPTKTYHEYMTGLQHIRGYAELGRECIRLGVAPVYRIWLLLRHLDRDGRGIVDRDHFLKFAALHGITRADLRYAAAVQATVLGADTFFTVYPDRLEYRGLTAVCAALGVAPGQSVYIGTFTLGSIEKFRANTYASWFTGRGEVHISRERLRELFGVSDVTMRRWERTAGVDVTFNVVEVLDADQPAAQEHIPQDARLDHLDRLGRTYTFDWHGKTVYRTVNGYQSSYVKAKTGRTRKAAREARVKGGEDSGAAARPRRRVFYPRDRMPAGYQMTPGACIVRPDQAVIATKRGISALWTFSRLRPATRRAALV